MAPGAGPVVVKQIYQPEQAIPNEERKRDYSNIKIRNLPKPKDSVFRDFFISFVEMFVRMIK